MSEYSYSDVERADKLWDLYPKRVVAEKTGIPKSTIDYWAEIGLISTDVDHRTRAVRKYDDERIRRADRLWDVHPIPVVSEIVDVPESTLRKWAEWGWIETDTDHRGQHQRDGMRKKVRRAAYLANETEMTNRKAAEKMGVAESTYYRYLRLYRKGEYE